MDNLVGQTIKDYELRQYITRGGFGAVYRAHQKSVKRDVAMKVIIPERANEPDFIRRFEAEAQIVARLESPYIVPLYDFWRDQKGAFLVMRWLGGGSLYDRLKSHAALSLEDAVMVINNITKALHIAHRNQVIHRDIKPGNILLDEDDYAYLTDFGIAKDSTRPEALTADGALIGTFDYLAPEQAQNDAVTAATDVYSLGVVLYEMLQGEHPFASSQHVARLFDNISKALPEVTTLDASVSNSVNAVIQKATDKNPEKRYQDVLTFAQALRQAAQLDATPVLTSPIELLTPREQDVLKLMVAGKTHRQIADELVVELATVKSYNTSIYRKLGVRGKGQAIAKVRQLEWFTGKRPAPVSTNLAYLPEPQNPYKGLEEFQAFDQPHFFGRKRLTEKLLSRIQEDVPYNRFLAVVGPSGSGKSSVVRAGLIPALWHGDLPGTDKWYITDMLPGTHPLDKLEVALIKVADDKALNLGEQLRRDERGLIRLADMMLRDTASELLIIIDQFEEVFTLVENESDRQHFLNLLYTAVTDQRSRVRVIVTLRADYYDRPLLYPDFGELLRHRIETVLPLNAEELELAVREPATQQGVKFEPGLVSRIVSDVNYQPGALPLLQYALTELFERRNGRLLTQAAYQEIGGTGGALAKRADEIFLDYDEVGRESIRQLFLRLVTLGEGAEDTRRRVSRSELLAIASPSVDEMERGSGGEVMDDIIDEYARSRLLSLDNDPATRQPTVEVAHEAILREWDRLRTWLNESRDDIRQQRIVAQAAEAWQTNQRDNSYLLRGTQLGQVEKWSQSTELALTPLEREFVTASIAERAAHQKAEDEHQERIKSIEKRSRNFLRGLVAVFAVATIIAASLSILAFWLNNQSQRNATEFRSIALTFGAQDALNHHQPDVALALAREAVNMSEPPLLSELTFYNAASSTWIKHRYLVSDTRVFDAVYHPDGKRIITASWDGRAVIWDIETERELQSFQVEGSLYNISIHPNGHIIAFDEDSSILLWNIETDEITELVADEVQSAPLFNYDGTQLISTGAGIINIWNLQTLEIERSFDAHRQDMYIPGVHLSQDEDLLISSSTDGLVKIWDMETGELLQTLDHQEIPYMYGGWAWDAILLDDGERVLTCVGGGIALWDWRTKELIWSLEESEDCQDIALSEDNQSFVVGLSEGTAELRDLETAHLLHSYQGHLRRIQNVDFSPDGSTVLSASLDGTAIIWPVEWEGSLRTSTTLLHSHVIAWHPSRPLLAVVGDEETVDGTIRLLDTQTGEVVREFLGHRERVASLAFSPDGRYLLSGDEAGAFDFTDQRVYVWDIETGEKLMELGGQEGAIFSIAFSPDARLVAVGETLGRHIILWDFASGERIRELEGHQDWVMELKFSPDGQYLYSAGGDGSLIQWDMQSGAILRQFPGHPEEITSIDLNADGSRLVSASKDQTAIIWDTRTGESLITLRGHTDFLWSVDFSSDDSTILTASGDGKIILWDAQTGARLQTYVARHDIGYLIAAFSPDGQEIASAANDIVTFWDASPLSISMDSWVTGNRYVPDFTCEQRELYHIEPLCAE